MVRKRPETPTPHAGGRSTPENPKYILAGRDGKGVRITTVVGSNGVKYDKITLTPSRPLELKDLPEEEERRTYDPRAWNGA